MDQKWIQILAILVFYQNITSGAVEEKTLKEGDLFEINCNPGELGTMIVWFRMLDKSGMEFIASCAMTGKMKTSTPSFTSIFRDTKFQQHVLILKSFNKTRDSGVYSCASLYKGNELIFGKLTRLVGEKAEVAPLATTPKQNLCTTVPPCVCNNKPGATSPSTSCTLIILGPLAGACGLLVLLLIITILYCNKIRTRRCPHHYKRKPRSTAPGTQMKTNRHV
ncbi:T-cell surface glycoprotein CD8 alpha chain [Enoplosus armatus]|uniref:T-cell surface glycoprotein CD8 alpha chain n=1 Tax=Enoplosus armatus TaxID=215367 RepID=UPI003993A299